MRTPTVRRLLGAGALVLAVLAYFAAPVMAQTTVTQTTTSAAVLLKDRNVTLTSVTGIGVGSELFLDTEAMYVTTLTGSVATVIRGYDGSAVAAHASGVVVYAGPSSGVIGSPFVMSRPAFGTCSAAGDFPYSLWINPASGYIWKCVNSEWVTVNNPVRDAVEIHGKLGVVIASAATIAPVSYVTHISGAAAIATITVPPGCEQTCQIVFIPDGAFTTTTGGNVSLASTAVVNKALIMTWDGTKWNPSY